MEIDHVLIAVEDLDAGAREIEERFGLASVAGGQHPGWGTANRIVPLGQAYIELIAVVDEGVAAGSAFGSWVAGAQPVNARLLGWVARTKDLNAVAARLGLEIAPGSRARPDGRVVHWRLAGVEQAALEPSLPAFIEWGPGTALPGHTPVNHPVGDVEIAELKLIGDADRIDAWLGGVRFPVRVRPGDPAVEGVVLSDRAGDRQVTVRTL